MHQKIPQASSAACSPFELLADSLHPTLHRWTRRPQRFVSFTPCDDNYFGLRIQPGTHDISDLPSLAWGRDSDFVLDFGIHMVGYLSFRISCVGANMDAPCRLRLTFGESPLDVTMSMDGVETWLSKGWLPDEIINIDVCPDDVKIRRRHAFRFLRVQVIDTSSNFKISISDVACECVSAISQDHELDTFEFDDQLLQDVDRVSILTLRDCMQSVFEDGPRRDRRMWIGDLRLQALANYSTLKDFDLVKRCILQFAAVARTDGSLPACLFERPTLAASADYLTEYDALFGSVVYDYVVASGDLETGRLLWATALGCLRRPLQHVNPQTFIFEPERTSDIKFLDWNREVDTSAGSHGVLLFCLKAVAKLAQLLQLEFPHQETIKGMTEAAQIFLSDGVVVSGPKAQISYASASWLVLAEAFSPETARSALLNTLAHPAAIKPMTPYLWHHVCDALITAGCYEKCLEIIRSYWGGMVKAGADTFWECYDPSDARTSPYGDVRMNSFCHAWSCTPTLLLRNQLLNDASGKVSGKMTMRELDSDMVKRAIGTS
ncbi:Bac-rhamnosid6H domain-containing protein [Fusarium keratoplasticum]|uniref:Bac-rhamnosid6H domain-containing protein n=1 Tax=Fusarium keratoplasticum TaxID=1328300 RepID=A0ACC0QG57_9HYPO|nr:Bac-rhamnosid6H domain-containing protein [Fusarium keratoplasticum]KAI8654486.1 Bac-rhamnosid6H domain-containing protein [Fusarium keratoplasticum]